MSVSYASVSNKVKNVKNDNNQNKDGDDVDDLKKALIVDTISLKFGPIMTQSVKARILKDFYSYDDVEDEDKALPLCFDKLENKMDIAAMRG